MDKPWYKYNYNCFPDGAIIIYGTPNNFYGTLIGVEMNIISRYIWGIGASLNSVCNGLGASVKFQSDKNTNRRRARLLTKVWRYCKKNNININDKKIFKQKEKGKTPIEDFDIIISNLKNEKNYNRL